MSAIGTIGTIGTTRRTRRSFRVGSIGGGRRGTSLEDELGRGVTQHKHEDLQQHPVEGRTVLLRVTGRGGAHDAERGERLRDELLVHGGDQTLVDLESGWREMIT